MSYLRTQLAQYRRSLSKAFASLACAAVSLMAVTSHAQTAAGTLITNQSSAQFEWLGFDYHVNSNIVYNTVAPVYGVSVRPDGTVQNPGLIGYGVPLQTIVFPYILTNTGNVTDSFTLRLQFIQEASSREPLDRRIYLDLNGNGRLDSGEVTQTVQRVNSLPAGDFVYLLVAIQVPLQAKVNDTFYFDLQATSVGDSSKTDVLNVNKSVVPADAIVRLEKSVTPSHAEPGDIVRYILHMQNRGVANARGIPVVVDGREETGILVYDPIPYNASGAMVYSSGSSFGEPSKGLRVFSTDGRQTWTSARVDSEEPLPKDVTDVGFLFRDELEPGQEAEFVFEVVVPSRMPPGRIENVGEVYYRTQSGTIENDRATNLVIVEVAPVIESVFIGPENQPRAIGELDSNDDFTLDPGVDPDTNETYRIAGNFVLFTNTVENAATGTDTLNITLDPNEPSETRASAKKAVADARPVAGRIHYSTIPKGWFVQFLKADGVTPLSDTNGDGIQDVGPLEPGQAANIVVRMYIPPDMVSADNEGKGYQAVVRATSSIDPSQYNLTIDRIPEVQSLTSFWDRFSKEQFAPDIVEPGSTIRYRNQFGHNGNFIVFNAMIIDELSPYLTAPSNITTGVVQNIAEGQGGFVSVTGYYDQPNHRIVWTIPTIPPNFLGQLEFDAVIADSTPAGHEIENSFTIQSQQTPSVRTSNLVRLVSGATSVIGLTKEANRDEAAIGDPVAYKIEVSNDGDADISQLVLYDDLARGFAYRAGSARVDGEAWEPEISEDGRTLTWTFGVLEPGASHVIDYVTVVTPEAPKGNGVNTVTAEAVFPMGSRARLTATADVDILGDVLDSISTIIGRVFIDANDNRIVDDGEPGIEGVRVYLDDGTYALTDRDGLYSFPGVRGKMRTVRLDQTTLPANYQLREIDDRNARNPASLFVDLRYGTLKKANFRVVTLDGSLVAGDLESGPLTIEPPVVQTVPQAARVTLAWQGFSGKPDIFIEQQSGIILISIPGQADISKLRDAYFPGPLLQSVRSYADENAKYTRVQIRLQKRLEGYPTDFVRVLPSSGGAVIEVGPKEAWAGQIVQEEVLSTATKTPEPGAAVITGPVIETPREGTAFISRDKITVRASGPLSGSARLLVNGVEVPESQIGQKSLDIPARRAVYEYVSVPLQPGVNILSFESNFRNKIEVAETRVVLADRPASIHLEVSPQPLYADGVTEPIVGITLLDENDIPTGEATVVTLETDRGDFVSPDFRPLEPGHQVQIRDGRAVVRLSHATESETRRLRVSMGGVTQEATLFFAPYMRDWIVVGTVEGSLGRGEQHESEREEENPRDKDGWTREAGTSVFLKGTLPWYDIVTTGNYDSSREHDETRLFREFQPDDYYPIYGDASELGYDAPSRDPLYLKFERGESYLMYGDFETGFDETELTATSRRFTGAKTDLKSDYVDFEGYAAYTDQALIRVEIPGQGVSGYYQLPHRDIVRGSEEIIIETRDRDLPTEVISSEELRRFTDYNFDYRIGRILFKRPIRAYDENFNPIVVVVRYELEDDSQREYWTYGSRVAVHDIDRRVTVGGSQIVNESSEHDDTVRGLDATYVVTPEIVAHAEYATSNTREFGEDVAYLAEIEKTGERSTYRVFYRDIGEDFSNPGQRGSLSGRLEYGVEGEWDLEGPYGLKTESYRRIDANSDQEDAVAMLDGLYTQGETIWLLGGGVAQAKGTGAEDYNDSGLIARAGVTTPLWERWDLELLHQQSFADIAGEQATRTSSILRYQVTESTAVLLAAERRRVSSGGYETNVEFGGETTYSEHLTFFNKYRVDGGSNGWAGRTSNGFDANYPMSETLAVIFGGEIVNRAHGATAASTQQDFWSVNGGFEYHPLDDQAIVAWRNEFRHDARRDQFFTEVGGTFKTDEAHTLFARNRATWSYGTEASEDEWIIDFLTGWAYRPLEHDQLNIISDFEIRFETGNGGIVSEEIHEFILSSEAIWQPWEDMMVSGKYAARYALADYTDGLFSDVKALSVRYSIWRNIYGQAGGRWLEQYDTDTHLFSYGIEGGVTIARDLQLGIGYNFDGFEDRSFSRGDYWDKGIYVRIRFKFDESILGWLQWMDSRREGEGAQ